MLDILSPIYKVVLRDFEVAAAMVDPNDASTFVQGMWVMLDTSNSNHVVEVDSSNPKFAMAVWSKKGEGSTQVLSQVTCLFGGQYEADTDQYNSKGSYTAGCGLTAVSGVLTPITSSEPIHAYCVLTPDSNNSLLRFRTA